MQVAGLSLEDVRREEEAARQDWEQAVPAVRAANDAVYKAYQRYLQAWKAVADATPRPLPTLAQPSSNRKWLSHPRTATASREPTAQAARKSSR
jgi:hypothetical protein